MVALAAYHQHRGWRTGLGSADGLPLTSGLAGRATTRVAPTGPWWCTTNIGVVRQGDPVWSPLRLGFLTDFERDLKILRKPIDKKLNIRYNVVTSGVLSLRRDRSSEGLSGLSGLSVLSPLARGGSAGHQQP